MTDEQWDSIALLLDKGFKWKESFGDAQLTTYRILLDGYDEEQIAGALRILVARGQVFGPTPGEIVSLIRKDAAKPTFIETYRLIYGAGGILRARPQESSFADLGERGRAYRQAQRDRAATMHPLVASFAERYGFDRLEGLELNDPDYGDAKRRELERQWDEHCDAMEGRDLAAIALPRSDRGGLARLDPLSALPKPRKALPETTTEEVAR